jgi:hypothetical protein
MNKVDRTGAARQARYRARQKARLAALQRDLAEALAPISC